MARTRLDPRNWLDNCKRRKCDLCRKILTITEQTRCCACIKDTLYWLGMHDA